MTGPLFDQEDALFCVHVGCFLALSRCPQYHFGDAHGSWHLANSPFSCGSSAASMVLESPDGGRELRPGSSREAMQSLKQRRTSHGTAGGASGDIRSRG